LCGNLNLMKFVNLALAACLLASISLYTQTVEPSKALEKSKLQLEFESLYLIEKDGAQKVNSWSIPSVLMRYGLNNAIELQLNVPYLKEKKYEDENELSSRTFFDNVQAGISVNLWSEKGLLPEAAVMARALIPIYDYQIGKIGTLLALNLSNTISEQLSLNYNLGWIADEEGDSGYYIANLSWEMSPTVHAFVEFFGGICNHTGIDHNINSGIGFNLGRSFCLDFSVAKGLNQQMMFFGGILTYQLDI
jgi:hypothetical protein